jgi:predicted peptidase
MCDRFFAMMTLLFTPKAYENSGGKEWPLIVYLHGGSRRGKDAEQLREPGFGLPAIVDRNESFPFVVLSPQCPEGEYWTDTEAVIALPAREEIGVGKVDRNR